MAYTTIQITTATREKLASLKGAFRGTYDDLLTSLLNLVPTKDDEGEYSDEFRASMLRGLSDIKAGRVYTLEEAKKFLGI
jgi:hypothetical protein